LAIRDTKLLGGRFHQKQRLRQVPAKRYRSLIATLEEVINDLPDLAL